MIFCFISRSQHINDAITDNALCQPNLNTGEPILYYDILDLQAGNDHLIVEYQFRIKHIFYATCALYSLLTCIEHL